MTGNFNSNDRLGLTNVTYDVPKEIPLKERDAEELRKDMSRHMDIQQQWSAWNARNGQRKRSGWPNKRRNEEGQDQQETAQA